MIDFTFDPSKDKQFYTITILVDSKDTWIMPCARTLKDILSKYHTVSLCNDMEQIQDGDFAFLLGCTKILPQKYLNKNRLNLVVHESALPKGKGWSPVVWQVLEGINNVPVVLFEARSDLDSGPIYLKDTLRLEGHELLPEIRKKQGEKTIQMVLQFLETWPDIKPEEQKGEETCFRKRLEKDDQIDIHKPLIEIFDHLRIVDNEKYPAWFAYRGKKYKLKIYQLKDKED